MNLRTPNPGRRNKKQGDPMNKKKSIIYRPPNPELHPPSAKERGRKKKPINPTKDKTYKLNKNPYHALA